MGEAMEDIFQLYWVLGIPSISDRPLSSMVCLAIQPCSGLLTFQTGSLVKLLEGRLFMGYLEMTTTGCGNNRPQVQQ